MVTRRSARTLRASFMLGKRIHAELGTTFVYVTHDQEEALVLSDRTAVFTNGHIEQVGTADELHETVVLAADDAMTEPAELEVPA
jgi:ABC-type Fe3+/spermidine/putrescine transport system ATPase subunit